MSFDIPIAHNGKPIKSSDLADAFKEDQWARFSCLYAKQLAQLNFNSKGFLTGSIDLVFTDKTSLSQARWWIVDWKSNWVGESSPEEENICCGPKHYNEESMEHQMLIHHYPLQAHLYLVALHRFLSWRLEDYSIENHLGGYIYIFLRGIPNIASINKRFYQEITPGLIVEKTPYERIRKLDTILKNGGS